jgi:TolB-like protein
MAEPSKATGAVFLSYASEDAESAARICEVLRSAGIEVWFDREDLRGGDAWDLKIKKQIHECALFLPMISAHTNVRTEGYFRREWKIATRRLQDIADDTAFLVPVVIDDTRESNARVPEEFLDVHWTRLPGGDAPPAFAQRVLQLLSGAAAAPLAAQSTVSSTSATGDRTARLFGPRFGVAGIFRKHRVLSVGLALMALLVLGAGAFWYYHRAEVPVSAAATDAGSEQPTGISEAAVLRLAVLPLENLSPDPENAFFADGLHDEILSAISATRDLQVVSRTTMRTYVGTPKTVKQIAEELGASHLLEGTVRRAGDEVRLTLQLIDAGTDSNIWSRTFDRPLRDVFSLQSEVAADVASALNVRLLAAVDHIKPSATADGVGTNPVAYDLYLKAKVRLDVEFNAMQNTRDYERSESLVTRAIELDPNFADAYALRARVLLTRLWASRELSKDQWQSIVRDIDSARQLVGDTAVVLAAQATLEYYGDMNYERALKTTRAALVRYPNDLDLRELEGLLLRRLGEWDKAVAVFGELVNREGANSNYVYTLAEMLFDLRRYREVLSVIDAFELRASLPYDMAAIRALAMEAIERNPELLGSYIDTWRDRIDPEVSWAWEQIYLRDTGRTKEVTAYLVATKLEWMGSGGFGRTGQAGLLLPIAVLKGYGELLRGATTAAIQGRDVLAGAARINWVPSREWNVALLEAHGALLSGDRKRAATQARRALRMMSVEQDALLGPATMAGTATVLAWAGQGSEAVALMRRLIEVPSPYLGWALVRDPLFAVPLAGNPEFIAFKREVDRRS